MNLEHLSLTSLNVIINLKEIEDQEKVNYEASKTVTLHNGKVLNREEQLDFFKQLYDFSLKKGACSQIKNFKKLYESGDFYNSWSILLANINWLGRDGIINYLLLPKTITIGKKFFTPLKVSEIHQFKNGLRNGNHIDFRENGSVMNTGNFKNGKKHGKFFYYGFKTLNYETSYMKNGCRANIFEIVAFELKLFAKCLTQKFSTTSKEQTNQMKK